MLPLPVSAPSTLGLSWPVNVTVREVSDQDKNLESEWPLNTRVDYEA